MTDRLAALVVDESKWLALAMLIAFAVVGARLARRREAGELAILGGLNLCFALVLGVMACGHLSAVSVRLAQGTLRGSPLVLYPLGFALLVPSAWLAHHALRPASDPRWRRRAAFLNAWLALTLLVLGPVNAPLAAPALLNVAYVFCSARALGRTILAASVLANLTLFVGSLVFAASGRSFEEFSAEYAEPVKAP